MKRLFKKMARHKIITGLILIILIGGGYYAYKTLNTGKTETYYTLAAAEKGTVISSISGTGQVSVSNQVDVKAKVSGDIIYVGVKNGQAVKKGALLAQIDSQDAQKSVRDAQANLESAQLSLEKFKQPTDALTLLQAENSLSQAQESRQNTIDNLQKAFEDGFNNVANAFLELPDIMAGLHSLLYASTLSPNQQNLDYYTNVSQVNSLKAIQYRNDADTKYQTARASYDKNFQDYKAASRFSDNDTIEALVKESYDTVKNIAEATKSTNNLAQFYKDDLTARNLQTPALVDTHLTSLNTYTSKTNGFLSNLLSTQSTIDNDRQSIINADRSIEEKTQSLAKLKAGPDELDLQSQELSLKQKQNSLLDAQQKLTDYYVRAPFDGIIAKVNVKVGDSASGATIATLISNQSIAEIALNEVDVAKVKIGQKANITFDAVDGLNIVGEVQDIDTLGTVSQGVVTYNVKIGFTTQDERVKPGMSLSAAIITDIKQDVLTVPNSAVKTQGNRQYVEMLDESTIQKQDSQGVTASAPPRQQIVETGLANDTVTEITNGLQEGDKVITRTSTSGASTATSPQSSTGGVRIPGITGGGFGGGGAVRLRGE